MRRSIFLTDDKLVDKRKHVNVAICPCIYQHPVALDTTMRGVVSANLHCRVCESDTWYLAKAYCRSIMQPQPNIHHNKLSVSCITPRRFFSTCISIRLKNIELSLYIDEDKY